MSKKHYFLIYLISLAFFFALSLLQTSPGYMDASYYFAMGQQIALGKGSTEPFIWNYLSNPQAISTPAFSYWMPLPGLIAALGMIVFHSTEFWAARIPFILLSGLIPVLCALSASKFTSSKFFICMAAGFGLFSIYYLPYMTIPETFVPFFVLGACFLLLSQQLFESIVPTQKTKWKMLLLGIVAGLMHLTRADGLFWLLGAWMVAFLFEKGRVKENSFLIVNCLKDGVILFAGYLIIMSGWFIRNLLAFGSLFPTGSNLTLWFTEYNDLFIYPPNSLNIHHWLESGLNDILFSRLHAGLLNIGNLIGVVGGIVLFPFMVIAIWKLRKKRIVQVLLIMMLVTFCLMTFVFPFAGSRGGYFHSNTAVQIFLWGIASVGFEVFITWISKIRNWKVSRAIYLFGITLIICTFSLSVLALTSKIFSFGNSQGVWGYSSVIAVDQFIQEQTGDVSSPVMVNDSPTYYVLTGRAAIQLTSCDVKTALQVMQKFKVRYLIIGKDHPGGLDMLFAQPQDQAGLTYLGKVEGNLIYVFKD